MTSNQPNREKKSVENVFRQTPSSSGLSYPDPYHGNNANAETRDERKNHEHVAIIIIWRESKQLNKKTPVIFYSARRAMLM